MTNPADLTVRNVRFDLMADSSPGLLARVLTPLARRDLTPDRLRSRRDGAVMLVEFDLDGVTEDEVDRVEGNLRQIVGMRRVSVEWRAGRAQASGVGVQGQWSGSAMGRAEARAA